MEGMERPDSCEEWNLDREMADLAPDLSSGEREGGKL